MDFYPSLTSSAFSIACHLASNSVLTFYSNAVLVRMAIVAMWALGLTLITDALLRNVREYVVKWAIWFPSYARKAHFCAWTEFSCSINTAFAIWQLEVQSTAWSRQVNLLFLSRRRMFWPKLKKKKAKQNKLSSVLNRFFLGSILQAFVNKTDF